MLNNFSEIIAWISMALSNFETGKPAINQENILYGKSKIEHEIKLFFLWKALNVLETFWVKRYMVLLLIKNPNIFKDELILWQHKI